MAVLVPGSVEWVTAAQEERRSAVARFNARRDIEWRLAVTLWGGFGLVANATKDIAFPTWGQIVMSALAGLVVVLHGIWIKFFMVRATGPNWDEGKALTVAL